MHLEGVTFHFIIYDFVADGLTSAVPAKARVKVCKTLPFANFIFTGVVVAAATD